MGAIALYNGCNLTVYQSTFENSAHAEIGAVVYAIGDNTILLDTITVTSIDAQLDGALIFGLYG